MTYGYNLQDHGCLCDFPEYDSERDKRNNNLEPLFEQANQFRAIETGTHIFSNRCKTLKSWKIHKPTSI